MVIDFHTHIFPDDLAPRAIHKLASEIDYLYTPVHDGTAAGLLRNMDDWGIDKSVVLPVVMRQNQAGKINKWAAGLKSDRLIPFGGIYPHGDDWRADIDYAVSLGLKGLKFHAEYQNFILDEPKMLKIYDYALGKGLVLLHHAGYDPAYPPPFRSSPRRFLNVVNAMGGGVIIAAHFGGHAQWDDVEKYLTGSGIYLDTSMGFEYFPHEQFLRIVKNHGADKILFASDSPWSSARDEMERLRKLPLSEDEIGLILGGNAERVVSD